jgi:predicted DNA-binding transcriptional regulator AlpA
MIQEILDRLAKLEAQPRLPELLTVNELAALLKTSPAAIRLRHSRGKLPAPIGVGKKLMWRASDVAGWLAR